MWLPPVRAEPFDVELMHRAVPVVLPFERQQGLVQPVAQCPRND